MHYSPNLEPVNTKMFATVAFFVCLLFCAASCILLPGRCPEAPPTNYSMCFDRSPLIIYSLPFSLNISSLVFSSAEIWKNDPAEYADYHEFQIMVWSIGVIVEIAWRIYVDGELHQVLSSSVADVNVNYIGVNGSVHSGDGTLLCLPKELENVRVWCEDPLVLIWSCREELNNDSFHEEALLIGKRQFIDEEITQDKVHSVAGKYLSSDLLHKIDLKNAFEYNNANIAPRYECKNGPIIIPTHSKWAFLIIFGTMLAFLTALLLYNAYQSQLEERVSVIEVQGGIE